MKKILLAVSLFAFISCDKEDDNKTGCNCDGKFSTPENYPSYFIIQNVKIDCDTRKLIPGQNIQPNAIFIGCK